MLPWNNMSMEQHIKSKCRAYVQLSNIRKIRKYLDRQCRKTHCCFVRSHIGYCNALLISLPKYLIKKLQMVQNTGAIVLCRVGKYDHITPTLKLHWLPVEFCIIYKVCLPTFNALNRCGPQYLSEMLTT